MPIQTSGNENPFYVPLGIRVYRDLLWTFRKVFMALGAMEPLLMGKKFKQTTIDRPVYITGLARAGSTVLLEYLNMIPGVATHKYRDYPALFIPFLWNTFLDFVPMPSEKLRERAHRDGIMINLSSPESMEEILWMIFFAQCHNVSVSHVLDAKTTNPVFEVFYRQHLRKILAIRNGNRYVSKANYNVSRAGYLLKMFPDARFVFLIRNPVYHVAAFVKQSAFIADAQKRFPYVLRHFINSGHFEYGLDMRPVNVSGTGANDDIIKLFQSGEDIRAWARYWNRINRYIYEITRTDEQIARASVTVRYEDLCEKGTLFLKKITDHCGLHTTSEQCNAYAAKLHQPTYYNPSLNKHDLEIIREETSDTARLFGY